MQQSMVNLYIDVLKYNYHIVGAFSAEYYNLYFTLREDYTHYFFIEKT